MNADQLFNKIAELIKNKKTSPKNLTFVELRENVTRDDETRESYRTLVREKRIIIREGINTNLIYLPSNSQHK